MAATTEPRARRASQRALPAEAHVTLRRWGHSVGMVIPTPFLAAFGLEPGAEVALAAVDGAIELRPREQRFHRADHRSVDQIFGEWEGEAPEPLGWGAPEGQEARW